MRKARISSIDYTTGMASVIYLDGSEGVTDKLPMLCIGNEYSMPELGAVVAVECTSEGRGIILGKLWNKGNMPPRSGQGVYHKKLNDTGEICAREGKTTFKDNNIELATGSGNISLKEGIIMFKDNDIEFVTNSGKIRVSEIIEHIKK